MEIWPNEVCDRAKPLMQEFLQRACGLDIQFIKEDFVTRVEHWSQSSASVVISLYVILCFADRGFGFVDCHSYPFHELINYL